MIFRKANKKALLQLAARLFTVSGAT